MIQFLNKETFQVNQNLAVWQQIRANHEFSGILAAAVILDIYSPSAFFSLTSINILLMHFMTNIYRHPRVARGTRNNYQHYISITLEQKSQH